jgi:hypothetical protein
MKTLALLLLLAAAFYGGRVHQLRIRGETSWFDALTLCHWQHIDYAPGWEPEAKGGRP